MDNKLLYKLEDFISLGYQWIEKIEEEYRNSPREEVQAILSRYYRLVGEWENQVKQGLPNTSRRNEFSTEKSTDPTYVSGKNTAIQNLVKDIKAKIGVLKEYKRELQTPLINM